MTMADTMTNAMSIDIFGGSRVIDSGRLASAEEQALNMIISAESDADYRLRRYEENCESDGICPNYDYPDRYAAEFELPCDGTLRVSSLPGGDYTYNIDGPMSACGSSNSRDDIIAVLAEIFY